MNIDQKFCVWCVRECLDLWDVPKEVYTWLDDPEDIQKAKAASRVSNAPSFPGIWAAWTARTAARAMANNEDITQSRCVEWAVIALQIKASKLRQEFITTVSDEELKTTDLKWIEHATVELFSRQ